MTGLHYATVCCLYVVCIIAPLSLARLHAVQACLVYTIIWLAYTTQHSVVCIILPQSIASLHAAHACRFYTTICLAYTVCHSVVFRITP